MKTAISLPDDVFYAVEAQASRLKLSRSEFFARAAIRLLAELDDATTTASYNKAFAKDDTNENAFQRLATRSALLAIEWEGE